MAKHVTSFAGILVACLLVSTATCSTITNPLPSVVTAVGTAVNNASSSLAAVGSTVASALPTTNPLANVTVALQNFTAAISGGLQNIVGTAIAGLVAVTSDIPTLIKNVINNLGDVVQDLEDALQNLLAALKSWASKASAINLTAAINTLKADLGDLITALENLPDDPPLSTIIAALKNLLPTIKTDLENVLTALATFLESGLPNILNDLLNALGIKVGLSVGFTYLVQLLLVKIAGSFLKSITIPPL